MTKTPYITASCDAEFRANAEEGRKYREEQAYLQAVVDNDASLLVQQRMEIAELKRALLMWVRGIEELNLQDAWSIEISASKKLLG